MRNFNISSDTPLGSFLWKVLWDHMPLILIGLRIHSHSLKGRKLQKPRWQPVQNICSLPPQRTDKDRQICGPAGGKLKTAKEKNWRTCCVYSLPFARQTHWGALERSVSMYVSLNNQIIMRPFSLSRQRKGNRKLGSFSLLEDKTLIQTTKSKISAVYQGLLTRGSMLQKKFLGINGCFNTTCSWIQC